MAITVQYQPAARTVAQAGQAAGFGDYARFRQQLDQRDRMQLRDIANQRFIQAQDLENRRFMQQYDAANQQYMQSVGVHDAQTRQLRDIAANLQQQQNQIVNSRYLQDQQLGNARYMQAMSIADNQQRTAAELYGRMQMQQQQLAYQDYAMQYQTAAAFAGREQQFQQQMGLEQYRTAAHEYLSAGQAQLDAQRQIEVGLTLGEAQYRQQLGMSSAKYMNDQAMMQNEFANRLAMQEAAFQMRIDEPVRMQESQWRAKNEGLAMRQQALVQSWQSGAIGYDDFMLGQQMLEQEWSQMITGRPTTSDIQQRADAAIHEVQLPSGGKMMLMYNEQQGTFMPIQDPIALKEYDLGLKMLQLKQQQQIASQRLQQQQQQAQYSAQQKYQEMVWKQIGEIFKSPQMMAMGLGAQAMLDQMMQMYGRIISSQGAGGQPGVQPVVSQQWAGAASAGGASREEIDKWTSE